MTRTLSSSLAMESFGIVADGDRTGSFGSFPIPARRSEVGDCTNADDTQRGTGEGNLCLKGISGLLA
jgi:hypothetical protein